MFRALLRAGVIDKFIEGSTSKMSPAFYDDSSQLRDSSSSSSEPKSATDDVIVDAMRN
ncbi:MAG: hypothetical protein AAF483_04375 [Planctomycetota bacterium]